MGRNVSIVTASGRREPESWQQAQLASVIDFAARREESPVRWIRIQDGEDATVCTSPSVRNLKVVTLGPSSSNRIGIARTRNRCISMLPDGWVVTLDSDDILFGDGLHEQIAACESAHARWGAALCNDISAAGTTIFEGPNHFAAGPLAAGTFLQHTVRERESPWVCSATLVDAELLRICGGWGEFAEGERLEDTALIARVTSITDGIWTPVVVQGYRKHQNQTTAGRTRLMEPRRVQLIEKYVAEPGWQEAARSLCDRSVADHR